MQETNTGDYWDFEPEERYIPDTSKRNPAVDYQLLGTVGLMDDISSLYVARYQHTGELVSLKVTDLQPSTDYQFLQEAINVSLAMRHCRHENIAAIRRVFVTDEQLWTVLEPLRVGSCRQLMEENFPNGLPELVVASLLKDLLRALSYLHENYFIHNNVRAANLMLDSDGTAKLVGFYQSVSMISEGRLRRTVYKFAGDPEWMAPEVLSQATTTNELVDIYSFGMTALELIYGKNPFEGWPALKILLCKMQYEVPSPPADRPQVSRNFKRICDRCLAKNPMKRPTAMDLLDDPVMRAGSRSTVKQFLSQYFA